MRNYSTLLFSELLGWESDITCSSCSISLYTKLTLLILMPSDCEDRIHVDLCIIIGQTEVVEVIEEKENASIQMADGKAFQINGWCNFACYHLL